MSWAQRLKRVFAIEIERCHRCGGKLRVMASIEEAAAAVRIGNGFPYMMVEARKMTEQSEAGMPSTGDSLEKGIASEGVIAYRIQTRDPTVQQLRNVPVTE